MSFPDNLVKHLLLRSLALASTFFCISALADYVVLESNSEQFPPGQLVVDPALLDIPTGTQLLLMSQQGQTLSLDGSATGTVTAERTDTELKLMLANLVDHTRDEHVSLGGTRGGIDTSGDPAAPLWKLNPNISGIQCVIDGGSLLVYRSDTTTDLELTVSQPGTEVAGILKWLKGQHETRWPQEVSVVDGERYVIKRAGWMESSVVQLQSIPAAIANQQAAAVAWLAANKCVAQAEKLLTVLD